jgi:hypothetical protein
VVAVTFKTTGPEEVLALFGLAPAKISYLADNAIDVQTTAAGLQFVSPWAPTVEVSLAHGHVLAQKKGTLDQATASQVLAALEKAVAYLMQTQLGEGAALDPLPAGDQHKPGALSLLKQKGKAVPAAQPWASFDKQALKSATPIKLRDATRMYQPVRGSSPNSRYFLVGANDDLRIAARYKGTSLSVRIEGPAWEKHSPSITACGFDNVQPGQGYASIHLHVADAVIAGKALGAILLGLGVELQTPVPNLDVIRNVGA